jgi:hypothetical protein
VFNARNNRENDGDERSSELEMVAGPEGKGQKNKVKIPTISARTMGENIKRSGMLWTAILVSNPLLIGNHLRDLSISNIQ